MINCLGNTEDYLEPFTMRITKKSLSPIFQACFPTTTRKGTNSRRSTPADAAIDQRALDTPKHAEQTVAKLGAYLAQLSSSQRGKARAIFRWITHHIDYDTHAWRTKSHGDLSPRGVLKKKKAVCWGYAGLFEELSKYAGLNVRTIS